MNSAALRILKSVAKHGDMAIEDVVRLAPRRHLDHRDQYPLAALVEEEYLGLTITCPAPEGGEKMREFNLAISMHLESLPRSVDGKAEYRGVELSGNISRDWKRVYLKAKGWLYLAERTEKRTERLFTIMIAVLSAGIAAWFAS